jgi:tripartite-type tricarboxylate transporter receptor subunit TctC
MPKLSKKTLATIGGMIAAASVIAATPAISAWPEKPVTVIVPFGAGGTTDITARTF